MHKECNFAKRTVQQTKLCEVRVLWVFIGKKSELHHRIEHSPHLILMWNKITENPATFKGFVDVIV